MARKITPREKCMFCARQPCECGRPKSAGRAASSAPAESISSTPCPECDGSGSLAGHSPTCGGGPRCESTCPIQLPCDVCETTGEVPV